jgi:hypothetical protein
MSTPDVFLCNPVASINEKMRKRNITNKIPWEYPLVVSFFQLIHEEFLLKKHVVRYPIPNVDMKNAEIVITISGIIK